MNGFTVDQNASFSLRRRTNVIFVNVFGVRIQHVDRTFFDFTLIAPEFSLPE
jgi:hypothetical protein